MHELKFHLKNATKYTHIQILLFQWYRLSMCLLSTKRAYGNIFCFRLYWHCDSCNEWYHPDCMGFDEKEEPHVYICPSCQVKDIKPVHRFYTVG